MPYILNDASAVVAQAAPREVRLADYAPPAFLVDTVDLHLRSRRSRDDGSPPGWRCGAIRPRPIAPRRCGWTASA